MLPNSQFNVSFTTANTYLDLGEQSGMDAQGNTTGTFNIGMKANAYSLSAGYKSNNIPLYLGLGVTYKNVYQNLAHWDLGRINTNTTMYDYGLILSFPFKNINVFEDSYLDINPAIGYSLANRSNDFVSFVDTIQGDPTPRTAKLGISVSLDFKKDNLNMFQFLYASDVHDLLLDVNTTTTTNDYGQTITEYEFIDYENNLGNIDFIDHIINHDVEEGDDIAINYGYQTTFLDILTFQNGRVKDIDGQVVYRTSGESINLNGIFKLIKYYTNNSKIDEISNLFNLKYSQSRTHAEEGHALENIKYKSITLSFSVL